MKRPTLTIRRGSLRLVFAATVVTFALTAGFTFARGGHGGAGHGGGGHFSGGYVSGGGHSVGGGAHFSGGHVGVGHPIGGGHDYAGHVTGGYVGGAHINSARHFGGGHGGTNGQLNHSSVRHSSNGSHVAGGRSNGSSHALSTRSFAAASHRGGINASHHHDGFHHHHHFSFFPFAFGAFYSAYPYYYGYPYSYGDPCDPYSPSYDPAYCDWLYSQGYYGNGSQYQPSPSNLPPQQNRYPRQQRDDANKKVVSSTTNSRATIALQSLAIRSESTEDVDLDEASAEYAAAIRAPLVAATSAPEALPQQPARAK